MALPFVDFFPLALSHKACMPNYRPQGIVTLSIWRSVMPAIRNISMWRSVMPMPSVNFRNQTPRANTPVSNTMVRVANATQISMVCVVNLSQANWPTTTRTFAESHLSPIHIKNTKMPTVLPCQNGIHRPPIPRWHRHITDGAFHMSSILSMGSYFRPRRNIFNEKWSKFRQALTM